jgi:hypothetical protein
MRTDLRHSLNEGMNNLQTWRSRYSKIEYPEKIVLNIFYRKYTIEFMFKEIIGCFEDEPKIKWSNFNDGFQKIKNIYGSIAVSKTQPVLLDLLTNKQKNVGNTNYGIFSPLIIEAKSGNKSKLEEIEYAYLYYLLADECVMVWAAYGGMGLSKIEAIGKMSGAIIKTDEIKTYSQIEQIVGQLCAASYLKDNYKALPPNI